MYGCESCNNLYRRLSTLELMLSNCSAGEDLKSPWTARRSNQWILKEIKPEYSLEGLMLKLQYFGHLMWRPDSLEKTVMLGKIEGTRKRWQRMRWLDSISESMDLTLSKLREIGNRGAWRAAVRGVTKSQTWLSNWTRTTSWCRGEEVWDTKVGENRSWNVDQTLATLLGHPEAVTAALKDLQRGPFR